MKVLFVPLFRMAVSYMVSFGRRWSILEQLLLLELAGKRQSLLQLTQAANIPERLVVEALINLLRAGWIEVRSTGSGVFFGATLTGKRRAADKELPAQLQKAAKWASLCVDRLTGSWVRAEDLQLVYDRDLPENAVVLEPKVATYDEHDGVLRDLIYLQPDEGLEPDEFNFRTPSHPYARVEVSFGQVEGLPPYVSMALKEAVLGEAQEIPAPNVSSSVSQGQSVPGVDHFMDDFSEGSLVAGGPPTRDLLGNCLRQAKSHIIIHSCFVHPEVVRGLLPDFEEAAKRKVRVDLLWGLNVDPEDRDSLRPITEVRQALNQLSETGRARVQLSPVSSGSHAKILLYDEAPRKWVSVVSSCNFLSSWFDAIDISVVARNQRLAALLLSRLIAAQIPASGSWSPLARRLNRLWNEIRSAPGESAGIGSHRLTLLADQDHYACVTAARDRARESIVIGCDIWGLAAETSVMVPMRTAAEGGRQVRLLYRRPSKFLSQEGRVPSRESSLAHGISIEETANLHGKFLLWDAEALAVTSFNWMSTVVDGARSRGAEFGVLVEGPAVRSMFAQKLLAASNNTIEL